MTGKRPKGLFITGTNTGVGKTFVAETLARSLIARGLRVGVYKPVLSGCRNELPAVSDNPQADDPQSDDDVRLWRAAGCPLEVSRVCPQRFRAPLAPHLAAALEGRAVNSHLLRSGIQPWLDYSEIVLVEGAGGLFSPISDFELNADLASELGFPLLVVTANTLGVMHATLATLLAGRAYRGGLEFAAIYLNDLPAEHADPSRATNFQELQRLCAPCRVLQTLDDSFIQDCC